MLLQYYNTQYNIHYTNNDYKIRYFTIIMDHTY